MEHRMNNNLDQLEDASLLIKRKPGRNSSSVVHHLELAEQTMRTPSQPMDKVSTFVSGTLGRPPSMPVLWTTKEQDQDFLGDAPKYALAVKSKTIASFLANHGQTFLLKYPPRKTLFPAIPSGVPLTPAQQESVHKYHGAFAKRHRDKFRWLYKNRRQAKSITDVLGFYVKNRMKRKSAKNERAALLWSGDLESRITKAMESETDQSSQRRLVVRGKVLAKMVKGLNKTKKAELDADHKAHCAEHDAKIDLLERVQEDPSLSLTPEEEQSFRDSLKDILGPFTSQLAYLTQSRITVLVGYRDITGKIETATMHEGTTKAGLTFPKACPQYETEVIAHWTEFTRQTFEEPEPQPEEDDGQGCEEKMDDQTPKYTDASMQYNEQQTPFSDGETFSGTSSGDDLPQSFPLGLPFDDQQHEQQQQAVQYTNSMGASGFNNRQQYDTQHTGYPNANDEQIGMQYLDPNLLPGPPLNVKRLQHAIQYLNAAGDEPQQQAIVQNDEQIGMQYSDPNLLPGPPLDVKRLQHAVQYLNVAGDEPQQQAIHQQHVDQYATFMQEMQYDRCQTGYSGSHVQPNEQQGIQYQHSLNEQHSQYSGHPNMDQYQTAHVASALQFNEQQRIACDSQVNQQQQSLMQYNGHQTPMLYSDLMNFLLA
ncbi:hypothetical protein C8J56DRAFT_881154 [Mycena floridula]|nr:hypothetical protein C8J56DRAFT_881154 [Mycena floridula]